MEENTGQTPPESAEGEPQATEGGQPPEEKAPEEQAAITGSQGRGPQQPTPHQPGHDPGVPRATSAPPPDVQSGTPDIPGGVNDPDDDEDGGVEEEIIR